MITVIAERQLNTTPEPSAPLPAVIYLHGGGWFAGERSTALYPWLNPLLAAHGFITVSITYRLSGQAVFPAQIYDAKAAVRWLRANAELYHIDPEHIGIWGDSAGEQLAALLGVTGDLPLLEGNCGSSGFSSHVHLSYVEYNSSNTLNRDFLYEMELSNDRYPVRALLSVL